MNLIGVDLSPSLSRVFKVDNPEQAHLVSCSFCEKTLQESGQLFVGEAAASCPECMVLAHQVIAEDLEKEDK